MGAACSSDNRVIEIIEPSATHAVRTAEVTSGHTVRTAPESGGNTKNVRNNIASKGDDNVHAETNEDVNEEREQAEEKSESEEKSEQSDDDANDDDNDEKSDDDKSEVKSDDEDKSEEQADDDDKSEVKSDDDDKSEEKAVDEESIQGVKGDTKDSIAFQKHSRISNMKEGEMLAAALEGRLDVEYPSLSRIVRIFTSSTFTDTQVERNTLMEKIYPRLKSFCQERGYDFQVVDMRWGVRDEATDDHLTSELCMRELAECQKLSTGPNFITFLGQKYGYRPFPPKIEARMFEKMLSVVQDQKDRDLLTHWFARDDNCLPPFYMLQPIRSKLPAYADEQNEAKRKEAQAKWWTDFERMQVVLRQAAEKTLDSPLEKHRYFWSVTEEEITHGLLNASDTKSHCFWFKRVITDLAKNTSSKNARRFMDISSGVDEEAISFLNDLKENKISKKLSVENIKTYEVNWTENGIDPAASGEHKKYIETLCGDFYRILCDMITKGIEKKKTISTASPLQLECMQHAVFAQRKCDAFYGRNDLLLKIKDHIMKKPESPLVVCGIPGSGKTSLMARSIELLPTWLDGEDAFIVSRFLGTSTESSNVHKLLCSLCHQLANACEDDAGDLSQDDLLSLRKKLVSWMQECTRSKPVYIFLDSLDQLDDAFDGREMSWVPQSLPSETHWIMSTVPDEAYSVLPNLKLKYSHITYLDVPYLGDTDITDIVTETLKAKGRQLQGSQLGTVKSACEKCATPLFLKIVVDEALSWKSYTKPSDTTLKTTVPDVINALLDKVEKYHGKLLVSHALSYITCAKSGLSETEIEDIMSCDDEVLNDVYQYHTPPLRRLPPLLWVRIRADLKDYLIDRGADGTQVITWYHRQFYQVVSKRYLADNKFRKKCHATLADFFLGKWAGGVKKAYKDKKGNAFNADRLVAAQPLVIRETDSETLFNLRKLSELPYHLIHSGQLEALKTEVFCNLMFLFVKLRALEFNSVLDDLDLAESDGVYDEEVQAVREALLRSRNSISVSIRELPMQLTARLISAGHKNMPFIKKLIKQCQNPPFSCLITQQGFLLGSSGSLLQKLVGHEVTADYIGTSRDGTRAATVGMDYRIKIWEVNSGKLIIDIDHSEDSPNFPQSFLFYQNNQILACSSMSHFLVWDLRGGNQLKSYVINEEIETHPVQMGQLSDCGWILVLRKELYVFKEMTWEKLHTIKDLIPPVPDAHHQQRNYCGGLGKLAVLKRGGAGHLLIVDLQAYVKDKSGVTKVQILDKGQKAQTHLIQIEVTGNGKIPCLIFEADKYMENVCTIKVFSLSTGKLLKKIAGFDMGFVVGLEVLRVRCDDHALFTTYVATSNHTLVRDINLSTGEIKEVGKVNFLCNYLMPLDDKRYLSISSASPTVVDVEVIEEGEKKDASAAQENEDSLFEDTMEKQLDSISPIPGTKRYMLTGCNNQLLQIWDAGQMRMVREINIRGYTNLAKMVSTDIAVTLTHTEDVMVYDMRTPKNHGAQKKRLTGQRVVVGMMSTGDGKALLASPKGLEFLDVVSDKVVKVIPVEDKAGLKAVATDREGTVAAGASGINEDISVIYMFDVKQQTRLPDIKFPKKQSCYLENSVEFSWDGKYLAAPVKVKSTSSTIWDTRTGVGRPIPDHEGNSVTCVAFSKATNSVVTGMNSGNIVFYDVDKLKLVRAYKPPQVDMVSNLTISPDGRIAACRGISDSQVCVYDTTTGEWIGNITADNNIYGYKFTWNSQFILLYMGSVKGAVQLYIHQTDKDRHQKHLTDGTTPIETALGDLMKEPAMYGTKLICDDFSA